MRFSKKLLKLVDATTILFQLSFSHGQSLVLYIFHSSLKPLSALNIGPKCSGLNIRLGSVGEVLEVLAAEKHFGEARRDTTSDKHTKSK
jgi:hypothetical protein